MGVSDNGYPGTAKPDWFLAQRRPPTPTRKKIEVQLHFSAAYKGNLRLYAVDWDSTTRRETITADGQTANLTGGNFSQGAWVSLPISVAAGASIPITVDRTAGANAVLSGIFLGDAGSPPAAPVSSTPQGSWVGTFGSVGYDLAGWEGSTVICPAAERVVEPRAGDSLQMGGEHDRCACVAGAKRLDP